MAWCLVRTNGSIFRERDSKYRLLKSVFGIQEPISKKSVKSFVEGDTFTVVNTNEFEKWFTNERNGRFYKKAVIERHVAVYTLKEIIRKPARVRYEEKHRNKNLG